MYDDLLDDPKVQRLDPVLFKTWVNLLCLASKNDGKLPSIGDIAFSLRIDESAAHSRIIELEAKGLIESSVEAGGYTPHNWDKRQYKSDRDETAAERQRRKRDKVKYGTVTDGNVTRDVTQESRAPDTDTDTERKIMSETSSDKPVVSRLKRGKNDYPEDYLAFYAAYPADPGMSKPEAYKAWEKLSEQDRLNAFNALPAFKGWIAGQGKDYRVLHACRYLSQRRFDGFIEFAKSIPANIIQAPVLESSPQWQAWTKFNGKPSPVTDLRDVETGKIIGRGWYYPTEWPPNRESRAA